MEIYRARGGCQDVRLLLLPFLDVLREPLKALKQTFTSGRATNQTLRIGDVTFGINEELTLGGHTMTCRASGGDPTSP